MSEYLLWVDVETSGLDPQKDALLEIAMALTTCDSELALLGGPRSWVFYPGEYLPIAKIHPNVIAMHSANGLWMECRNAGLPADVWAKIEIWAKTLPLSNGDTIYLAGRSVHFDRSWLERYRPYQFTLWPYVSHRHFDLSSLKMFMDMAGYDFDVPDEKHRAGEDVEGDIKLARALLALINRREKFSRFGWVPGEVAGGAP